MSDDLRDLYQEVILDHYKRPRNFGALATANRKAEGHNPLCGDNVTVYLQVEEGVIRDLRFAGSGCAISTASASLMTESLKGKTLAEAEKVFGRFHRTVTGEDEPVSTELGKLAVLAGVREYPVRVKCATLAWHTLNAALRDLGEVVSTE
jgi:nitrogen fixation NifU-like protein